MQVERCRLDTNTDERAGRRREGATERQKEGEQKVCRGKKMETCDTYVVISQNQIISITNNIEFI